MTALPNLPPVDDRPSTFVPVTRGDADEGKEGNGKGEGGCPGADPTRARTRVRARERMLAATDAVTHGVHLRGVSRRTKTPAEAAAPDIHETDTGAPRHFWHDGPAPAADLMAYTRSGAWLRGQQNWMLELGGKTWGYGVALPVTLILGALIWCVHRFHRAAVLAVVIAVLWVSAPSWSELVGSPSPAPAPAVETGAVR